MKKILPFAAVGAALLLLRKKNKGTSGVGYADDYRYKERGHIVALRGKRNDRNGNPSFEIVFQKEDGTVIVGRTPSASSLGYRLGDYFVGKDAIAEYRITPTFRRVFTDIILL